MGAMVGSLCMYSQWYPLFDAYYASTGTIRDTDVQAFWFTAPNDSKRNWNGYCNEIYQTGILLFGVFAITDPYNPNAFPNKAARCSSRGWSRPTPDFAPSSSVQVVGCSV